MPILLLGAMMDRIADHIPFLCSAVATEGKVKIDLNRIVESIVIAVILGLVLGWAFKPELANIKENVSKLEMKIDKIYNDIYTPTIKGK